MTDRWIGSRNLCLALLAAGGSALLGCGREAGTKGEAGGNMLAEPQPMPVPEREQVIPLPTPALDRETLLLAIARAASASGSGADDRQAQAGLAGRPFTFRIRFGCTGSAPDRGAMKWSYDAPSQTLKIRAQPDISLDLPAIKAMAGAEAEAAEGFWVTRPWLLTTSCPADKGGTSAQAVQPSEVGLAQFFTSADSRVQRRSRPFETVQKLDQESLPAGQGFNLVLAGRLKALPDGRVIKCLSPNPNVRPTCLASVEFDRVSIQNAETRATIAEWGVG